MGLTPLDGLPGASRAGHIDPSLIFHYTSGASNISDDKLHVSQAEKILNFEAGWKSLTGTSDFREITTKMSTSAPHKLAFDIFADRINNYVGAFYVKLRGNVDALVFAGGVGEKSQELRKAVVNACECLGFAIDKKLNAGVGSKEVVQLVGEGKGGAKTLVCQTDEQFEMARQCALDPQFNE